MRSVAGDGIWLKIDGSERRLRAARLIFPGLGPCGAGLFFGIHRRTRGKQADRESMSLGRVEPLS